MTLFQSLLSAPTGPATPATLRPSHQLTESEDAFALTIQLPGVARDGLDVTVEQDVLRVVGRRAWTPPAGWSALHRETSDAPFSLAVALGQAVAADRIAAELRDGVLRLSLPKAEAVRPRRITVA
jgi:HSP20 family molecular chaperone IbpA